MHPPEKMASSGMQGECSSLKSFAETMGEECRSIDSMKMDDQMELSSRPEAAASMETQGDALIRELSTATGQGLLDEAAKTQGDAVAKYHDLQKKPAVENMPETYVKESPMSASKDGSDLFGKAAGEQQGGEGSMSMDATEDACWPDMDGTHKEGEFQFYLLVAPCPKTVTASVYIGRQKFEFKSIKDVQQLKLPKQAKPFLSDYACFRLCFPSSFSAESINLIATFHKSRILTRILTIPIPGSKEVIVRKHFYLRNRKMQIEVLHKPEHEDRSKLKLALDSVLVLLNNPCIMSDCFAENVYHNRVMHYRPLEMEDVSKMTQEWVYWIQQECKAVKSSNMEWWALKMVLAVISQIQLLRHSQQRNQLLDNLWEHYVELLHVLSEALAQLDSFHSLPLSATSNLQQVVNDLVNFTPASQWSLYLDALCKVDPQHSFLKHWTPRWGNVTRMEKQQREKDYKDAISQVLHFAEAHPSKTFKQEAIQVASLAAPTGTTFFESLHILLCSNLLLKNATEEEVESGFSSEYGQRLVHHFEWLIEVETPRDMAQLLLEELKTGDKVITTVLRILTTIFLRRQIFAHPRQSKSSTGDNGVASWDYLIPIWAGPRMFTVPLLGDETTFMYDLACKGNLELVAHAIVGFVEKLEAAKEAQGKEAVCAENLRTWVRKVCARAADAIKGNNRGVPITPHSLYSMVGKLFERGLCQSGGFLADALNGIVRALLQQRCGIQEVLQDARQMSFFDCFVLAQQYHLFAKDFLCEHLQSADDKNIDCKAEELLRWLCITSKNGIFLDGWIQRDLCISLLDALIDTNAGTCDGELVESSFKILLLQVEIVSASDVHQHTFYNSVMTEWTKLQKTLEDGSMSIEVFRKLTAHPIAFWERICEVHKFQSHALRAAAEDVSHYRNTFLKGYRMLLDYAGLAKGLRLSLDVIEEARSWLERRAKEYKHFTLREIKDRDHWPLDVHDQTFKDMLILEDSKLLKSLFESKAGQAVTEDSGSGIVDEQDSDDDSCNVSMLWKSVVNAMRISLDCYQEEWRNLLHPSYPAQRLSDLLHGVTHNDIEIEGSLAQRFFSSVQEKVPLNFQWTLAALAAWIKLQEKRSLLAPLRKVQRMLGIIGDEDKIADILQSLCKSCVSGSLGDCLALYNGNVEVINYFTEKEGVIIKQLADSEQLINFLKENSDDDLRLLTDAIEEQAEDALIDEATVSDIIHIDKVFRPLLKNTRLNMADMKAALQIEIKDSDAAAGQLSSKLGFCTSNIHRIRHFVASLADRSSVLKDNMHSIMQSGIYTFAITTTQRGGHTHDACTFSLRTDGSSASSSSQNSRQHFNLSDLRDLRSRARMLLSRRRTKHESCSEESTPSSESRPDDVQALEEFVKYVDLAEALYDQVSIIHGSGHLLFDSFEWSGSGRECLQEKVQWMNEQIACWNAALQRARLHFTCLNFFKGVELRLIHHCFSSNASLHEIQLCCELLDWAKPGLNKDLVEPHLESCICSKDRGKKNLLFNREVNESQLYACLQNLSTIVTGLFTSASVKLEMPSSISVQEAPSILNEVDGHQDSVLLVSVEEQHCEFNVVVEIFHRNKSYLRNMSNNLLLCSSATNWEEVYLLILRFLASDGTDDGSHAFVIAFVEKLRFECQLQLMTELQEVAKIPLQQTQTHKLALVCWTGSQALQGISHHLKVPIQFMNGYAPDIMKQLLPRGCEQMVVVTSELSGMGKSTSIKAQDSVTTITISGEVSVEALILRLRNLEISAENALHIDITAEKGYESLNRHLFELLILGALKSSEVGVCRLATNKVYVELANTLGNCLESNLPVCSWLAQQHFVWDLDSLHISEELESDEQVVCLYLDALATDQLDSKDIVICGANMNVIALPEGRCKELLYRYFIKDSSEMSNSVLTGFLKTLAYQLRKLSATDFYTVETLCWILRAGAPGNFRSNLVASLLEAAKELSLRSVKPWLHGEQLQATKKDLSTSMHERMSSLLGWSESNHIMIFFDVNGPASVLYRDKKLIPEAIKTIMSIQVQVMGMQLPDYNTLSSLELWSILSPILGQDAPTFAPGYALTPDNFLKMALISLRINTRVPVIIMGETGCGKTSLLRALATCSNANFSCLTLHAGSTEQDIETFINEADFCASSRNTQVWAFLDEINACYHLGLLNGILCHHTMHGRLLPLNLVVLAACNPYRLQDRGSGTVGLRSDKVNPLKNQVLTYKVQPLPEAMLDYVWDYGILSDSDERIYISSMVDTRSTDIIDVLSNSQKFMRKHMGLSSVSLRDIQRWISLYDWFQRDISLRLKLEGRPGLKNVEGRSKVLACSLCYHCRLPTKELRKLYREMCCTFLRFKSEGGRKVFKHEEISEAKYLKILQEEELDVLERMEIPHGIAKNSALLENVFVVLVCILNYLPVFVVGKPGSGKTLALQIIYSNLRGVDSKDKYFQKLPRILMLSYQGSQNSTSEGILKVFDKAKRYVQSNRERDMLVVLVLDEIGLAETSCHNPLKVLHPLLEPEVQEIAVVGISNWSLDAAKMNRGIHLSQSDPEEEDLYKTGVAILESYNGINILLPREKLRGLATAYYKYHTQQARPDFHGLRDFYSLIKSLRLCNTALSQNQLAHSLWRNFGGGSSADVQTFFLDVEAFTGFEGLASRTPTVMSLIKGNLQDPEARHLLLITKGDSASGILQHMLQQEEDFAVIRGSTYKDDKNEEYCYLLLGEVILHMEMGRCILLENADQIWSSLYDMLNQHYTMVGGRKNCRIALGVYSNPMCYVHDKFRCIVVVDHEQIPLMDPPFLNRFEKQNLTYESILDDSQQGAVESIRAWAQELAAKSHSAGSHCTSENQLFSGFFEDSVPSLVMLHWNKLEPVPSTSYSQLLQRCKIDLLQTAYIDAIARVHLLKRSEIEESYNWTENFLSWPANQCLDESIKSHISSHEEWTDSIGVRLILTTCTPIQWSIEQDIENSAASSKIKVCCMRLGDFTSEKQLQTHIQRFWSDEYTNMLVLQADDVLDRDHISLAKIHIDKARKGVLESRSNVKKHVLIIIHVQQGKARLSRFSFLCGWKQLTINRLQREPIDIRIYLEQSIPQIIAHEAMPIKRIMARVLTWSYLCIKYEDKSIHASYPQEMVQLICQDELICTCLKEKAVTWVLAQNERLWQLAVFNNQKLLSISTSVHDAFVQYLEERLREALARLIYLVEKTSSLKSYFLYDSDKQQVWRRNMLEVLDCDTAPAPCYPEGYALKTPLDLHIPFSSLYAAHLNKAFKHPYLESLSRKRCLDHQNSAGNHLDEFNNCIQRDVDASLTTPLAIIGDSIHFDLDNYVADFSKIYIAEQLEMSRPHVQAFEWVLRENLASGIQQASDIHILLWMREEELKAQVSLALLSLSAQEIEQEVGAMKAGRSPNRNFTAELVTRCCFSLMPTVTLLSEVGGIEAWLHNFKVLLNLLPPVGSADLVFLLQTLHDFALFVILPLHLDSEQLCSLANWFKQKTGEVSIPFIVEKIMAFLPDLHTLDHEHACRCWISFFCSVLKRIPHLPSFSIHEMSKMLCILVTSPTPSCMTGHVMVQLLNNCFFSKAGSPVQLSNIFNALISDAGEDVPNEDWGSDEITASNVILADHLYYSLREIMSSVFMSRERAREWDHVAFDKCFDLALQACEDGPPFSMKKVTALAFMKSFLFSAASLINEMYRTGALMKNQGHCQSLCVPASIIGMLSNISSTLRQAIQVFFMKVLHSDFGLSADDLANALNYCENDENPFSPLSCLLDSPLLRNARNRLGFNPFAGSSNSYMTAEFVLRKLLYGTKETEHTFFRSKDEEQLNYFLRSAGQGEQAAFVAAIASNLFVMKSGGPLSDAEWSIIEQVQGKLKKLNNWDPLVKQSLRHLTAKTPGGIWHRSEHLSENSLRWRCLILNILVTILILPVESPLQGYSRLDPAHLTGRCILTQLDNVLQNVEGIGREFVCECGYIYTIGECTRPAQVGFCPECGKHIGGLEHTLVPGNSALRDPNSSRVMESSLAGKARFAVRIQPLSYRLLRVLVHYCFLIGITTGSGNTAILASALALANDDHNLAHELSNLIEADMAMLDKLLACQREMTYQFIHSVLQKLPQLSLEGPLLTAQQRDQWEIAFESIVQNEPAHEAISKYLESKRTDGLHNLLQERAPSPPVALQNYFRMTRVPSLSHYETMFMQNKERAAEFPCIAAVLAHAKHLTTLSCLMPIVDFSATLHQVIGHKITRQAAAVTTIQEILYKNGHLEEKFEAFKACWNSVRLHVKGYECRQFQAPIPSMDKTQPIALCLLEKKDQGIYLTAILELLRDRQNAFLEDSKLGLLECTSANVKYFDAADAKSLPSVCVQLCKASQVVGFDEQWANNVVSELGMCNPAYGKGTQVEYDDYHIEIEMQRRLIQGKAFLDGDYIEFPYQQESFQRHATLTSDVAEQVTQAALPTEILSSINRELTAEGLGAGQLLVTLELCLGFLHRTNADPSELLREYCKRWLGSDAHPILSKGVFDSIEVRHVVSLYEGLEGVASSSVEDMVAVSYRSELDAATQADLMQCVVVKKAGWSRDAGAASSSKRKLGAEAFRDVLKRFMFRCLTTETFKPDDGLGVYLTDERLVAWPVEGDGEGGGETLDEIFPSSFQLKHARALYLALKQMCN